MHNIPKESFLGMELALPTSLEEQSKIAKQFASLDNLITLHQRKRGSVKCKYSGHELVMTNLVDQSNSRDSK